jgi:hypothetical protein
MLGHWATGSDAAGHSEPGEPFLQEQAVGAPDTADEPLRVKPCRHALYDCRSDRRSRVTVTRGAWLLCPGFWSEALPGPSRRPDTVGVRPKDEKLEGHHAPVRDHRRPLRHRLG